MERMGLIMGKYSAQTVANYFLFKQPMSQKKLHKMLFFAYSWYLYEKNDEDSFENKLFEPEESSKGFQAWVHGPVYRELYPKYANNGFREIYQLNFDETLIDDADKKFFEEIFDVFGTESADELEKMSHTFVSWKKPREGLNEYEPCSEVMDDSLIYMDILLS
ncbi:MAG: Panacea domain-containing protein [Dysgonomonas sp.]